MRSVLNIISRLLKNTKQKPGYQINQIFDLKSNRTINTVQNQFQDYNGNKKLAHKLYFTITVLEIIDEKTENDIDEVEETF